ncbi:ribonucleases P/MRP protein subunit POP1 isoform X2 [Rhodamnia argentea]|nr:ribonucleases P/MRP protein subunit POP1 isoform X2 [Rhodamnia argentea]XP_048129906.1 ribonucleases P/MRP protein subunit POP1 isoform X2 [Rhodamnia argentea]XP_048129907.1 ribonucleases P/MRP protein subunit POP1 isoform X2 [Rhodamnia argentea]XP_048129908.1 ribonucleases P/MRP protein subunit POP1 isoform X2 [Rhodamnia argentea]
MGSDGSKRSMAPRTLSVRKFAESRAAEVENLHSVVADRLSNNFRSRRNKRRRTTAHENQLANRRHRQKQKDSQVAGADRNPAAPGNVPRRVRRRNELKQNPQSGFCTSGDGTRRLRTHVWHAKRFTMTKLWGFYLPLGLQGRGRGSRALLKWYKQGVVIHDASYHFDVQLEGPQDSLISVLDRVLVPSPSAHPIDISQSILSGVTYGRAMLHHVGTPLSKPIAPVIYMWRCLDQHNTGKGQQDCAVNGEGVPENIDGSVPFRRLWVWVHVSAFTEGYDALKCACQKEMDEFGSLIHCSSLEGHLTKLEVMGSGAFKLLRKILHPIKDVLERPFQLKKHSSVEASKDEKKMERDLLHSEDGFPSCAILSLNVKDPREYKDEETVSDSKMIAVNTVDEVLSHVTEKQPSMTQPFAKGGGLFLLSQAHHDLWDVSSGIRTPIEENVLHTERHKKRMDFLCLDSFNSGMTNSLHRSQSSRSCPIVLLRNGSADDHLKGWSIILPLSWVKAFWIPFISKGAHAIGLREKHWIANNAYMPYFPWDFPDCNAYTSFMAIEAVASQSKADCRPPAVRALKGPIPPPWSAICPFDKAYTARLDTLISSERSTSNSSSASSLTNSSSGVTSSRLQDHLCGFRGSVVRTNKELTCFLKDYYGGHSFLFPYKMVSDRSFLKAPKAKSNVGGLANGISLIMALRDLCFLRVTLHALKEGFFEEGAIVCAPRFTDISSRASRLENNKIGLQMPQSAAASYFKEVCPGEWEIQVPEDPIARESHRWPIGFVTTGFVRGSKKLTAEAFCEVNYLAHLREEQWTEMHVERRKREIYVLVRNMRSSAYRLALATIVLEQKEDDLEFM